MICMRTNRFFEIFTAHSLRRLLFAIKWRLIKIIAGNTAVVLNASIVVEGRVGAHQCIVKSSGEVIVIDNDFKLPNELQITIGGSK